jgi:hypothetical protein
MSETLRQRLLAAVFDDEVIGDDLVRDLALSSDAHGELVRLATVLAGLPGHGARAAEARLDGLLDHVSLVAASMSALARGSDVMRESAGPPLARPADPRTPSEPHRSAGQRPVATPGRPPTSKRIRVDSKPVLVGVAVAAAIIVDLLAWQGRHVGGTASRPGADSRPVTAQPAPPPSSPGPAAPVRAAAHDQLHLEIRVSPSTATITIDGVVVDGNPFSGSRVRDGSIHRIGVRAPGYVSQIVPVAFRANLKVDVSLERARAEVAAVMPPPRTLARQPLTAPSSRAAVDSGSPAPPRAAPPPAQPAERPPSISDGRVQLMITTDVPGSEIAIDDIMVGTTPLREPLWVRPGRHEITVMHEGYAARTRFIDLDAASAGSIEIGLTSLPVPAAAIDASGPQPARRIDPVNPYGSNAPDR